MCILLNLHSEIPKSLRDLFQTCYTSLEYSFFAFIFWINIRNRKIRRVITIASVLFLAFQFIYYFKASQGKKLDSVPIGIETILILVYIFFFFFELSKSSNTTFIYNNYCFWISVGILIYLGGSFFFYILIDLLSDEQVNIFGNLTYVAEIIKNVLFAIAILIYALYPIENPKQKPSVPYLDMI